MSDYYDLLQQIQKKPGLYIGNASISSLYMFLIGYNSARRQLSIPLSDQEREFQEFQPWLQEKFSIKTSQAWSKIILFYAVDERDAFERFFVLFHEFLHSKRAQLGANQSEEVLEIA
ncbi:MAG: hypothetical protein NT075_06650 [Chloroflexi bacterium]|nr:hypothetical protein [Chloroflexota bacterium]